MLKLSVPPPNIQFKSGGAITATKSVGAAIAKDVSGSVVALYKALQASKIPTHQIVAKLGDADDNIEMLEDLVLALQGLAEDFAAIAAILSGDEAPTSPAPMVQAAASIRAATDALLIAVPDADTTEMDALVASTEKAATTADEQLKLARKRLTTANLYHRDCCVVALASLGELPPTEIVDFVATNAFPADFDKTFPKFPEGMSPVKNNPWEVRCGMLIDRAQRYVAEQEAVRRRQKSTAKAEADAAAAASIRGIWK